MNDTKAWYTSKGVVGALVSLICLILVSSGVVESVSPEDEAKIAELVVTIIGGIASLVAIYGRIRATHKIGR